MSRETCVPTKELGNPASDICQPAEGRWVVREESVASFLRWGRRSLQLAGPHSVPASSSGCHPTAPPFQVTNSKESFARQSRLLCIAQEQATNICFSMSNSKLIYLRTKKAGYQWGTRTLQAVSLRRTRGSWLGIACKGAASLEQGQKGWWSSGWRKRERKCWPGDPIASVLGCGVPTL